MDDSRVAEFIRSHIKDRDALMTRMKDEARESNVPIVREESGAFILTVMALLKPESVLELGTATGYSAILMAGSCNSVKKIDTIENWQARIPLARKNIEEAGLSDVISVLEGDALEVMKGLEGPYDMVFIDAAKGQYPDYLEEAIRLTHKGSVIISDNILQDGDILESKFAVERRHRTIHKRLRDFLDRITADEMFTTSIIPIGDGVTFSVRNT